MRFHSKTNCKPPRDIPPDPTLFRIADKLWGHALGSTSLQLSITILVSLEVGITEDHASCVDLTQQHAQH